MIFTTPYRTLKTSALRQPEKISVVMETLTCLYILALDAYIPECLGFFSDGPFLCQEMWNDIYSTWKSLKISDMGCISIRGERWKRSFSPVSFIPRPNKRSYIFPIHRSSTFITYGFLRSAHPAVHGLKPFKATRLYNHASSNCSATPL